MVNIIPKSNLTMIRPAFARASKICRNLPSTILLISHRGYWHPRLYSHPQLRAQRYYAESFTLGDKVPPEVTNLSMHTYHEEADMFLESLSDQLEELSQKYPESVPDVELTQGVMQLELRGIGNYVINKQPPNKQIWLASPVSGPKRFDFYKNEWVSLRDGSKLLDILNKEVNQAVKEESVNLASND